MSLPQEKFMTIDEFYRYRENKEGIIEFIDGFICMAPSPSTKHQRISMRLSSQLYEFLRGKECEVFSAPFDIKLKSERVTGDKIVIPDLSVICDKKGLGDSGYEGVPTVIMEILSPSNQAHDLVFKLNLYMVYGVREYWIINPMLNTLQVYVLDENYQYEQAVVKSDTGKVSSHILKGFSVDLEELFT
ncbi:hypothetical protein SDC9_85081 [bioreactor metagenome]|uniref:Putative restriction endonuclease domain-containing protein n=1 Tax=bioreactor metagenome TaxID=1076179 RepID=A0A644ZC34_9ZZZZ